MEHRRRRAFLTGILVYWLSSSWVVAVGEQDVTKLPPCNFPAIYNFGDSNSDTGGISAAFAPTASPYGETFFGKPAGRACDGRLILDFIAQHLQLPYVSAYLNSLGTSYEHGANFATGGATIQRPNQTIFQNGVSPFYLDVQIVQFDQFKSRSIDLFTQASAIQHLYQQGARTFWIHNTGPLGCLPVSVMFIRNTEPGLLDPHGCHNAMNEMAVEFNQQLKDRVNRLTVELPHAALTCVDVYTAKFDLIKNTKSQGFMDPLKICCGHHDTNIHIWCGQKANINGSEVVGGSCGNPSAFVNWDGVHYSQAANQWVANHVLNGSVSDPPVPISHACYKHA
ncbi:GDSL lipase/esterase [Dillenia turbinata]|uniref:GDSL lipase/esterase n=1 Tax=Dillenia turbinata TaxID=194707 RepID=A0AAN8UKX2_9MAGN